MIIFSQFLPHPVVFVMLVCICSADSISFQQRYKEGQANLVDMMRQLDKSVKDLKVTRNNAAQNDGEKTTPC